MIIHTPSGVSTSLPFGFGPNGSTVSPPSNLVSNETTFQVPVSCLAASSANENPVRNRQQVAKTSARILFIQAGPSELSLLVRYIPNRVHQSARCPILAQLGPRPMSAMRLSGDTRTSTLI